jgi:hypothetical protein
MAALLPALILARSVIHYLVALNHFRLIRTVRSEKQNKIVANLRYL